MLSNSPMDVTVLIDGFPVAWKKLFCVMRKHSSDPWQKMDEFFNFEFKTQYVEKPSSLPELVSHLCITEPVLEGGQIKRVPRLFHLPCVMQRHLVWFIYRHKRELSLSSVCSLLHLLATDVPVEKDKTLTTAHALFKSLATKKTLEDKATTCYNFSRSNKDRAAALIRRFSRCVEKSETPPVSPGLQTCLEDDGDVQVVQQHSVHGSQPSFMEVDTPQNQSVSSQNATVTAHDTLTDANVTKSTPNEIQSSASQNSSLTGSSRKRKISTSDEGLKHRKIDDLEPGESISDQVLSDDLEDAILTVRNCWTSASQSNSQPTSQLSVFEKLSESQMKAACKMMKLSELNDEQCAMACSHLVAKSKTLSFCNASIFAEHCILPKLKALGERCLRVLLDALIAFAENFYRQMAACVFIPLMKTEELNQYQAAVITEVAQEGFGEDQKMFFLSSLTKTKLPWTEVIVSVFHPIVNYKMKLGSDDSHNLLTQLADASLSLSNSLKFTKLLISFINIYASQLNVEDQQGLHHIVSVNTTFLKKAATAALKKVTR